jgi:hypothetical protein
MFDRAGAVEFSQISANNQSSWKSDPGTNYEWRCKRLEVGKNTTTNKRQCHQLPKTLQDVDNCLQSIESIRNLAKTDFQFSLASSQVSKTRALLCKLPNLKPWGINPTMPPDPLEPTTPADGSPSPIY